MKKALSLLTLVILFFLTSLVISACSGSAVEATPTQEEFQSLATTESIESSPEASPEIEPTEEPAAIVEPSPTSEAIPEPSPTVEASSDGQSELIGKTLLEERCTACHNLNRVTSKSKTLDEWKTNVERMVDKGADLNADEQASLIQYLAETYP
jgi:hypothetical protein